MWMISIISNRVLQINDLSPVLYVDIDQEEYWLLAKLDSIMK